jgi:hypothetical protein
VQVMVVLYSTSQGEVLVLDAKTIDALRLMPCLRLISRLSFSQAVWDGYAGVQIRRDWSN